MRYPWEVRKTGRHFHRILDFCKKQVVSAKTLLLEIWWFLRTETREVAQLLSNASGSLPLDVMLDIPPHHSCNICFLPVVFLSL